jgi:hypothetical protein
MINDEWVWIPASDMRGQVSKWILCRDGFTFQISNFKFGEEIAAALAMTRIGGWQKSTAPLPASRPAQSRIKLQSQLCNL